MALGLTEKDTMSKVTFKSLIESKTPTLIDFYADWCGPCQVLGPIIEEVKQEVGEKATVLKIDVDRNQELAQRLQIRSIPTMMIFKEGELKWRGMGVQAKGAILSQLEEHMETEEA